MAKLFLLFLQVTRSNRPSLVFSPYEYPKVESAPTTGEIGKGRQNPKEKGKKKKKIQKQKQNQKKEKEKEK